MNETTQICPWCSTSIPANATTCPKCGAVLDGAVTQEIPGVTVVDSKATFKEDEGLIPDAIDPIAWLEAGKDGTTVDLDAVRPPSDAVRLEMRKIELETQIENAGTQVMNPDGDESLDVGAPSQEALEAYGAGLLDRTGPAGEKDLDDLAAPWEDPELDEGA